MNEILEKYQQTKTLSKADIVTLLKTDGKELFVLADKVREKHVGNEVYLRGLIEFSNICKNNCLYCGIRRDNQKIDRYKLSKAEILELAKTNYKTTVLQSGEGNAVSTDELADIIKTIKQQNDVAITLSIGEKSFEEYKILKDAGADRFLLRIETTDKNLYQKMHPDMSFENRVKCLKDLKTLKYEVGTGCLVGLPEQTLESLANDILFFKELDADMVGIGPLIIHPDTPLRDYKNGNFELALKVMAITRLLLPDINIPATTAMETLHPDGRIIALQSGANVVMPNLTSCKEKYDIYPNKSITNYDNIEEKLKSIGRTVSNKKGFRHDNIQ